MIWNAVVKTVCVMVIGYGVLQVVKATPETVAQYKCAVQLEGAPDMVKDAAYDACVWWKQ